MKKILLSGTALAALCGAPALAADLPVKAPVRAPVAQLWHWTGCYIGIEGGGSWGRTHNVEWVLGIEEDISWTNKKGIANEIPPFTTTATVAVRERWIDTLRGRIGYKFGAQDQVLLYVTGGGAWAGTTATTCVPGVFCNSASATRTGWTFGAGGEWAIFPPVPVPSGWWSVKIEYLYVDFGSKNYNFNPALTTNKSIFLNDHIVRAGLNWHF